MRIPKVPCRGSTATAMVEDPGKVLTHHRCISADSLPTRPTRTRKRKLTDEGPQGRLYEHD
jgi:hypothetical protein